MNTVHTPANVLALQENIDAGDNLQLLESGLEKLHRKMALLWAHTSDGYVARFSEAGSWVALSGGEEWLIGLVDETGISDYGHGPLGWIVIRSRNGERTRIFLPGVQNMYVGDSVEVANLLIEILDGKVIEAFTGDESLENKLIQAGFGRL